MPKKQESKANKQLNKEARSKAKDAAYREELAILDDTDRREACEERVTLRPHLAIKGKDAVIAPAPCRPIVVVVEDPPDRVADSWEDLIVEERLDMERCFNVAVADVGAGTNGLTAALERRFPTHCLTPVVVPTDIGRRAPAEFAVSDYTDGLTAQGHGFVRVQACNHKLRECSCNFSYSNGMDYKRPRQWLLIADESLYYLNKDDLSRLSPGDRVVARFHAPEESCTRKQNFTEHREVNGLTISRTGRSDRPGLDYYHVAGKEFLRGVVIDKTSGLSMYPRIVERKGDRVIAVFHVYTQRLSCDELDAEDIPSYGEAKMRWKGGSAITGATSVPLNGAPPGQPTPTAAISVMPSVAPKLLAGPLNAPQAPVASTSGVAPPPPTPPPPPTAAPKAATPVDTAKLDMDEIRDFIRTRLTAGGLKTGTMELAVVSSTVQRRFPTLDSKTNAVLIGEELKKLREAQLHLAKVATEEQKMVSLIKGDGPTDGQRFIRSIIPFTDGFGNGRFMRAKWNRHVALPSRDLVASVAAADSILPPGCDIIKA